MGYTGCECESSSSEGRLGLPCLCGSDTELEADSLGPEGRERERVDRPMTQ